VQRKRKIGLTEPSEDGERRVREVFNLHTTVMSLE
jgi:hypothetical protein